MSKFNFSEVVEDVRAELSKSKKAGRAERTTEFSVGSDLRPVSRDPKDYVVMPEWWEENYGVLGLPFGKIVQIAGDSDTGKTSLCITAMKAAQEQGYGIVYAETELKTSPEDLIAWGVDPSGVLLVQTNITEKVFDGSLRMIEGFFKKYPKEKLLYVIDSFGNTISKHDKNLELDTDNQKVGGAAKTNRLGLGRLIANMEEFPMAILLVNYDYANIGTMGKTQAGGKALKFFTMIGISSARLGDYTVTKAGVKVKKGAHVRFSVFKNHYLKSAIDVEGNPRLLPTEVDFTIDAGGIGPCKKPKKGE